MGDSNLKRGSITDARVGCGLSTTQLAYRLGVSQSTVVRMEKSERERSISLATLARAADALGFDLEYSLVAREPTGESDQYFGRKRLGRSVMVRENRSAVNDALRTHESDLDDTLSVSQRIARACELSDVVALIQNV